MATVIDSLFIELGLDTTKFDAAQKKSIEQLRKFDTQSQKAQKNTQAETKKTTEGFDKATQSLVSFGTAFVGISTFTDFVSGMTSTNAALSRNSSLFSMSAHELDAWGGVLKSVGGDASNFQSSIQNIQSAVASMNLGGDQRAFQSALSQLGALNSVDLITGEVDFYKLADALKAFKEAYGAQSAFSLAQQIGLDKPTFMALQQGADAVHKLKDASSQHSKVTDENTAAAAKLQSKMGDVENAFGGVKNKIMDQMYPSLITLASGMESVIDKTVEWDDALGGLFSKTSAISGTLLALAGVMKVISIIPGPIGFAAKLASIGLAGAGIGAAVVGGGAGIGAGALGLNPEFESKEKKYNLPSGMLDFLWQQESTRGKNMVSPKGATGHFGFMPDTATAYGMDKKDTFDLNKSSEAAAHMMRDLLDKYNGNMEKALAAYNWGSGNIQQKGMENMPKETSDYLESWNNYKSQYDASVKESKAVAPKKEKSEIDLTKSLHNFLIEKKWKTAEEIKNDRQNARLFMDKIKSFNLKKIIDPKGFGSSERNKEYNMLQPMIGSSATAPTNTNTSNKTNIQNNNVTVNTQATDAKGIARELPKALDDNAARMLGMGGSN